MAIIDTYMCLLRETVSKYNWLDTAVFETPIKVFVVLLCSVSKLASQNGFL